MTIIKTSLDYLQQKNLNMRLIEWFWVIYSKKVMYLKFAASENMSWSIVVIAWATDLSEKSWLKVLFIDLF